MSGRAIVAGFALRESLRRRVFLVVALLTVAFLALYGARRLAGEPHDRRRPLDPTSPASTRTVAAATMLGLAMFATLFLGAILAVFLTLGAVRGDAERGLLQPLLVRPLSRARAPARPLRRGGRVCAAYVVLVFLATAAITWAFVGWWPDRTLEPALELRCRRRGPVRALAGRLGRAVEHGQRDRRLHALRRRADRRAARPDRRGARLGDARGRRDDLRAGCCPFEALYQDALRGHHGGHRRLHAARASSSGRSAARTRSARGCGRRRPSTSPRSARWRAWAFARRDL